MMTLFKIQSAEEVETEILKQKGNLQNFPKTVDFPFPERYKNLATAIKTMEISSETILYNSVEAVNNNKEFVLKDFWCFAGNGQGDRWLMDKSGLVFFYDHDYDERLEPMGISFEQWLQMSALIQQLDLYFDELGKVTDKVRHYFYEALDAIHPALSESYPFRI